MCARGGGSLRHAASLRSCGRRSTTITARGCVRRSSPWCCHPRSEPPERWLSRGEAARLIWSAWRYHEIQKGHPTGRRARAHVARFLIAAHYTARRKDALLAAPLKPTEGRPWIDLDRGVFYGRPSARRGKKRQPPIRIPTQLPAHMRRWRKNGQAYLIEFNGAPIGSIDKAFAANVDAVGLDADVVVHTTRHTAITWLAMGGVDPYEPVCRHHHGSFRGCLRASSSRLHARRRTRLWCLSGPLPEPKRRNRA